jgi:NADH-quinone oxidoreductase subunit N
VPAGQVVIAGEVSNLTQISDKAVLVTWIVAVATLVLGNTVALAQTDLKRLLAYSSIAHAGYLLVGLAAAFRNAAGGTEAVLGADAILFYLVTYALMTLGAFGVIIWLHTPERPVEKIDDLSGLMWTNPVPALALVLCLFSLAGIPPLAGFWGKFRIFQAALEAARGDDARLFQSLAVIGVVCAAIGAYYYLRLIVIMIFREPSDRIIVERSWPTAAAVLACTILSVWIGIFPGQLAEASRRAAADLVTLPDSTASADAQVAGR